MGWDGLFSKNNCTWADPKILKSRVGLVSMSSKEYGMVSVPAEGTIATGVRSVVNVVGARVRGRGRVGVAANC